MRFTRPALVALLVLVPTPVVTAQTTQYTAPGGVGGGETPDREQIEAAMERSRWRLGPFRVAPWLALRGLTYEDDVFVDGEAETSDVHGALGAGLSVYLPTGEDVFWVVQAMPEYLFWVDLDERNQLVGRYGAGLYADLNRLRLAFDARASEQQQTVTSESAQQTLRDETTLHGSAELEITGALTLAVEASTSELAYELPDGRTRRPGLDFADLDREEQVLAGELRYRPGGKVEIGLGAEVTEVDFAAGSRDRSSTGTSPFVRLALAGNRLRADLRVVQREIEPEPGSLLVPVDEVQGSGRLALDLSHRFTLGLYASRGTAYAIGEGYLQFDHQRYGVDLAVPAGRRLTLSAFAEGGEDAYEPLPGTLPRSDDATAWGLAASFEIGSWLTYRAGVTQVDYDSTLPQFDRDYLRVESALVLSTSDWVWE